MVKGPQAERKESMEKDLLLQEIDAFVHRSEKQILDDLALLISKRSVRGEPEEGAPYGKGPREALDTALAIARRLGLSTKDGDGHVGWGELPGREKDYIGVIAHVDIVPEGDGWNSDPYVLTEKDGWLIGRGVLDNKGAAILALYAAAFLKNSGRPMNYTLRILLGCAEETGMEDAAYYLRHNPEPMFCFTPDVDFPVVVGEKGIHSGGLFVSAPVFKTITSFAAGIAGNVIPSSASCVVHAPGRTMEGTEDVDVTDRGDGAFFLEARGIGGHAGSPEGKVNAIGVLTRFLLDNQIGGEEERLFLELLGRIHSSVFGAQIGIACETELLGKLTSVGCVISQEGGVLRQNMNIRYPESISGDDISQRLKDLAASYDASFEGGVISEPFYISPDSPSIKVLLSAYEEITGHPAKAYTMCGGTYARCFKNAVGYGPGDTYTPYPSFVLPEHSPNEGVCLASLREALKVYILALWQLQDLPAEDFIKR